jgi:Tol biopolymer transport system component
VCDLYAGTNALVSVGINGTGGSANSYEPAISGNGRYVAFTSAATNLIAGDANNSTDVFVRDLLAQTTSLVSVDSTGTGEGNLDSYSPAISSDGRFVLFVSLANNLAAGIPFSGTANLFLRDRQTGVTYALTTTGQSYASMTPDGHFIAFTGNAGSSSIYLWDAQLAQRVATNTMTAAIQAISISPDGNRIACFTGSSLLSLSTWDRAANQVYALGTGYLGSHFGLRFSADSRYLTYALSATANGTNQIYLYDFLAQKKVLVSHGAGVSTPADGTSDSPDISADGRFVVYRSAADNIVTGDTNGVPDVFLFDATTGTNTILSSGSLGNVAADNRSLAPVFSGDGHTLVFRSWGTDLAAGDFNQSGDLFAFAFLYAAITANNGGNITLNWPAAPNQTFGVQYKNDLTDPAWNTASGSVTIIGHRGYLTDTALTPGHRFYRIVTGN